MRDANGFFKVLLLSSHLLISRHPVQKSKFGACAVTEYCSFNRLITLHLIPISDSLKCVRFIAATKSVVETNIFTKGSPVHTKRFAAERRAADLTCTHGAIYRRNVLLQLVA